MQTQFESEGGKDQKTLWIFEWGNFICLLEKNTVFAPIKSSYKWSYKKFRIFLLINEGVVVMTESSKW